MTAYDTTTSIIHLSARRSFRFFTSGEGDNEHVLLDFENGVLVAVARHHVFIDPKFIIGDPVWQRT